MNVAREILDVLRAENRALSKDELARRLGLTVTTIVSHARTLERSGEISARVGHYAIRGGSRLEEVGPF